MTKLVPLESIVRKIVFLRGKKVLLDNDLAELYDVETKQLKRAVRRHVNRFPEDFMFQLSNEEFQNLRSHFGTSSWGGTRYMPMAFTEQGVAMLSSVLNSDRAIEVNINIMRAFVQLRKMIDSYTELSRKLSDLERKLGDHDEQIQAIFETIYQLMAPPDKKGKKKIGFTVKEKQKAYSNKTTKKKKTSLNGSFTPKAKKIWEDIDSHIRIRLLNNVWCRHCGKMSSIGNLSGMVESGMLVLRGSCTKCGSDVARVIENK